VLSAISVLELVSVAVLGEVCACAYTALARPNAVTMLNEWSVLMLSPWGARMDE
jgi:hypothetical protein